MYNSESAYFVRGVVIEYIVLTGKWAMNAEINLQDQDQDS